MPERPDTTVSADRDLLPSGVTGNPLLGNLTEQFAVELVDKTLSLFLAAAVAFLVFGTTKPEQKTPGN
jgi:hypothetical protein